MRARPDGLQQLLRLGGREDEDEVLRRFLHDLQQGVEAGLGDHVRLIDDEHAVAGLRRGVERPLAQLAHVVDTVVRRRVHLGDVQGACPTGGQCHTGVAGTAGGGRRPLLTVQRPGQDACRRGLSAAARSGEQVGVVDSPAVQRRRQRLGHMFLPHDLGKRGRTILPVKSHGTRLQGGPDTRCPYRRTHRRDATARRHRQTLLRFASEMASRFCTAPGPPDRATRYSSSVSITSWA